MTVSMEVILREEFAKEFGEEELESEAYKILTESLDEPNECSVQDDYLQNTGQDVVSGDTANLCAKRALHDYLDHPETDRHVVVEDLRFYFKKAGKAHLSSRLTEIVSTAYQCGIRKRKAELDDALETHDKNAIKAKCAELYKLGPEEVRDYVLTRMLPTA